MLVPPAADADAGVSVVMTGALYESDGADTTMPPEVTITATGPAELEAGAVKTRCVVFWETTVAALPPTITLPPAEKPAPVTVMAAPPDRPVELGLIAVATNS